MRRKLLFLNMVITRLNNHMFMFGIPKILAQLEIQPSIQMNKKLSNLPTLLNANSSVM